MIETNVEHDDVSASGKHDTYLVVSMLPIILGLPQGFVFLLFWNWFVKPLGLPGIDYWHAYGLMVFVSFIRYEKRNDKAEDENVDSKWFMPLLHRYGYYLLFLLRGWLAHLLSGYFIHS